MKRLLLLGILGAVLVGTALVGLPMAASTESLPTIEIDGKVLDLKTPPVIDNGTTMVPFRAFGGRIGGNRCL
ncbi:MAG: hypothetical protein AAGU27_24045 [Dehalobacterium sp.]